MFPNFPKIPGVVSTLLGNDTWYDGGGNQITPDPFQHNEIFDATGQRHVFAGGSWSEDDPRVSKAFPYVMSALSLPGTGLFTGASQAGLRFVLGAGFYGALAEPQKQNFHFMTPTGNYLDNGEEITPDDYRWLIARWGDNPPIQAIQQWEDKYLPDIFDADPADAIELDELAYQAARYNNQGLVKIGKQVNVGSTFYINGHLARLGTKAPSGHMQYAITEPGEGDRWKYKITKDRDGNWVRTYYRTYGARREKLNRLKEKGKDE